MARAFLDPAELGDAAGVIRDRAEGVHGQDVGSGHQHAHRRDGGPEDAADVGAGIRQQVRLRAEPEAGEQGDGDGDRGHSGGLEADGRARDDVGGRAGLRRFGDVTHRTVGAGRVVLGDVDEGDAGGESDDACREEIDPGREAADPGPAVGVHHHVGRDQQTDDGQQGRDPVAAVEHVHRVFVFLAPDEEDRDDRRQQPEGANDQRKEDPGLRVRPTCLLRDREHGDAQDHRADVLGGGRFEQVRPAACAVADIVTDEVGDDARVAGVVFRDALLDLAREVRADVGSLGVDAATELREQRDERGPEAETDDEERRLVDRHLADEGRIGSEDAPHPEERQGNDEEAGHRATAHRDLDRLDEAATSRRCRPDVGLDGDEHADDPRRHRAGCADEEGDARQHSDGQTGELRHVGDGGRLDDADDDTDHDRADDREDPDGRVLTSDEGSRTLVNGAGHVLHRLGPGVARQDVPGQVDREQDGDDPGRQDDQLERAGIHRGQKVLHQGLESGSDPGAWRAPLGSGRRGSVGWGSLRCPIGGGTLQAVAECNKAQEAGSNPLAEPVMQVPDAHRRVRGASTYTARLVTRRSTFGCLFEIVETLVLTLIIFLVIQTFVAQPYKVQQQSMEHTLEPDQYVLVDKLTPRFDTYKRGDIVVFTPPPDWIQEDGTPFIKRVIGLPGDTVDIHDGSVFINGTKIDEPYLYSTAPGDPPQPTTVPGDTHRWVVS